MKLHGNIYVKHENLTREFHGNTQAISYVLKKTDICTQNITNAYNFLNMVTFKATQDSKVEVLYTSSPFQLQLASCKKEQKCIPYFLKYLPGE